MYHPVKHFLTITRHKLLVMKYCFRIGLIRQGLMHDMSKYSPTEFLVGAKYYQGDCSPNNAERLDRGVSTAWLHHKGRNRHHFEYWIDYNMEDGSMCGMKMPVRFVAEAICDRIAACRIYMGTKYSQEAPYEYFARFKGHYMMHPETEKLTERLLLLLRDEGEKSLFSCLRRLIRKNRDKY